MYKCKTCGREMSTENNTQYKAIDFQDGKKILQFCCAGCLKRWITGKITGMCITLGIGLIWAIPLFFEMGPGAFIFLFTPYMIRQVCHSLRDVFHSGSFGEFFSFFLVLLGSLTVIYPACIVIKEIKHYRELSKRYSLFHRKNNVKKRPPHFPKPLYHRGTGGEAYADQKAHGYAFYSCSHCGVKLRTPAGLGHIILTCPKCNLKTEVV